MVIGSGMLALRRRDLLADGYIAWLCGLSYAVVRFALEFGRGDPRGAFLGEVFSPAQVVSLVIILVCFWARPGPQKASR